MTILDVLLLQFGQKENFFVPENDLEHTHNISLGTNMIHLIYYIIFIID